MWEVEEDLIEHYGHKFEIEHERCPHSSTPPPLLKAILENNLEAVEEILQSQPEASQCLLSDMTPFYLACDEKHTHLDIVRVLLASNPSAVNPDSWRDKPALSVAVTNHRLDIVKFLLENKALVNAVDDENYTALHFAVAEQYPNEAIINLLIDDAKIDVSHKNNFDETALEMLMAKKDCQNQVVRLRVIEKLLKLEHQNNVAEVPGKLLAQAVAANQLKVVKQVLDESADLIDAKHLYAVLQSACGNENINYTIVDLLHVHVKWCTMENHLNLVQLALTNNRSDIVKLVLRHASRNPGEFSLISKKVIYHLAAHTDYFQGIGVDACFAPLKFCSKPEIVSLICLKACSMGVPVGSLLSFFDFTPLELNQVDQDGWTMLHHAVHENHLECVRELLKNSSVQTRAETFERETALFLGCAKKDINIDIIELLLKRDRKCYRLTNDTNRTVLDLMVKNERVDLIELFWKEVKPLAQPFRFFDLNITHAFCECVALHRPNLKMITALAKFPMPDSAILRLLLLTTNCNYEWDMNEVVLDKLLDTFFYTYDIRYGSKRINDKSLMSLIRQYLMDLKGPCEYASSFDFWFFTNLVHKLPASQDYVEEVKIMESINHCHDIKEHAYAILALHHGYADADLRKESVARSSHLFQCVAIRCVESDTQCSLILNMFRHLFGSNYIQLDYHGIQQMLGKMYMLVAKDYTYEKLKRVLTFIEELIFRHLDIGKLMKTVEHPNMYRVNRFNFIVVHQLMKHLIADQQLLGTRLPRLWYVGGIVRQYLPKYGMLVRLRRKCVPHKKPSSLKQICRHRIHKVFRGKLEITDYLEFIEGLECPESLKIELKLWPTPAMARAMFCDKSFENAVYRW